MIAAMPRRGRCYRGFIISWEEPRVSAHEWVLNVSPEENAAFAKLGRTKVITGTTLEDAWAKARKFIDDTASQK